MTPEQMRKGVAGMTPEQRDEWLGRAWREAAEQQGELFGLAPAAMASSLLTGFITFSLTHLPAEGIEAGLEHVLAKVRTHIAAGNKTVQ